MMLGLEFLAAFFTTPTGGALFIVSPDRQTRPKASQTSAKGVWGFRSGCRILVATATAMMVLTPAPSRSEAAARPSITTIKGVEAKGEAVRVTLIVTLTCAASYRITRPAPDRIVVDFERADFDFKGPVDLKTRGGWITDWSYGYLMLGYTRLSVQFDRKVSVARDEMTKEGPDGAELSIHVVESP